MPLTISVPSSRATCRFFSSSSANFVSSRYVEESGLSGRLVAQSYPTRPRLRSALGGAAATSRGCAARAAAEASTCAGVARKRQEEGVRRVGGLELVRVLLLPAAAQKDEVTRTRRELLPPEAASGRPTRRELPDRPLAAVQH